MIPSGAVQKLIGLRIRKKWLILLLCGLAALSGPSPKSTQAQTPDIPPDVERAVAVNGTARIVVALRQPAAMSGFRAQTAQDARAGVLSDVSASDFTLIHDYQTVPALVGEVTAEGLETLTAHPDVAAVALDLPVAIASAGSAAMKYMADRQAADLAGFTGAGVNVAVLDTGVDTHHIDLADRVISQHCFDRTENCPPADSSESDLAQDENGHGTHVAGIIASRGQTSPQGTAPEAGVVAVRVLGSNGTGFSSDVVAGIDWVVANQDVLNVKVMNLSLGGGAYEGVCDETDANTMLYAAAAAAARQAGITIFAASGNQGLANQMMAPACVSGILSVGNVYGADFGSFNWPACVDSVAAFDQIPCSSNGSSELDLLAPGVQVTSTRLGGGQSIQSGTSMSTAHATGVAALLLEANPNLTPPAVESVLRETGLPVTDGRNERVTPRLDAAAALNQVTAGEVIVSGIILLQGRTDHGGSQLLLSESSCVNGVGGTLKALTGTDGSFEVVLPAGHNYQCLLVIQPGYLTGQTARPHGDLGVATLPAGEVTGDHRIDIFDLAYIGSRYGQSEVSADVNADGFVDIIDLALVAGNYKKTGPVLLWLEAE